MLAIASAWIGLLMCGLSIAMVVYRPLFNDVMLPIVLYGAVLAITFGGLVLMRRTQPEDLMHAVAAQKMQAKVGIALGTLSFMIVYVLLKLAQPWSRGEV